MAKSALRQSLRIGLYLVASSMSYNTLFVSLASAQKVIPSKVLPFDSIIDDFIKNIDDSKAVTLDNNGNVLNGSGISSLAENCRSTPSTRLVYNNVLNVLKANRLVVQYESVIDRKVTIYTKPNISDFDATFYYYSAEIFSCERGYCNLRAKAVRVDAPLDPEGKVILLTQAKSWSDPVSGYLIEAASPQALCGS